MHNLYSVSSCWLKYITEGKHGRKFSLFKLKFELFTPHVQENEAVLKKNRKMLNIHMFSKVEELMSCQEPLQMLMLPENVQPGFQIFL